MCTINIRSKLNKKKYQIYTGLGSTEILLIYDIEIRWITDTDTMIEGGRTINLWRLLFFIKDYILKYGY